MTLSEKMALYSSETEKFLHKHIDTFYKREEFQNNLNAVKPLFDSFAYSLFAGGKRLRPFLCMEFCSALGKPYLDAISYASAIEMIHTFSLIHDDLPCMDNDDMRRGKPTNHKVFGEGTALLSGDALAFYAFNIALDNSLPDKANLSAVRLLANGAGVLGMIAGQQIDMWAEDNYADTDTLTLLQNKKTGALFETACLLGCTAAGFGNETDEYKCAVNYTKHFGLAFQITDDILDVCGDSEILGKNIGSDEQNGKSTFVTQLGVDGAKSKAKEEICLAKKSLDKSELLSRATSLYELCDFVLNRNM